MAPRWYVVLLWPLFAMEWAPSLGQDVECYNEPCSLGWLLNRNRCYMVTPEKLPFNDVEAFCQGFANRDGKAHLASVHDKPENDFIVRFATSVMAKNGWAWIGYTDQDVEGTFVWTDSSNSTNTNWRPGEPKSKGGVDEDFVAVRLQGGGWNDSDSNKRGVCKITSFKPSACRG